MEQDLDIASEHGRGQRCGRLTSQLNWARNAVLHGAAVTFEFVMRCDWGQCVRTVEAASGMVQAQERSDKDGGGCVCVVEMGSSSSNLRCG
jgi:hypothetical protein